MIYVCSQCGNQQLNEARGPRCPQCRAEWHPDELPVGREDQVSDSVIRESPKTGRSSNQTDPPFEVFVRKKPLSPPPESVRICVEVKIQNRRDEPVDGIVWLVDGAGLEGTQITFHLPAAHEPNPSVRILHPELEITRGLSGLIAIRVQETDTGVPFWQANHVGEIARNSPVNIAIDNSQRGETNLGGLNRHEIHLHALDAMESDTWQKLDLGFRGPIALALPRIDRSPPDMKLKSRPVRRGEIPPPIKSSRLTLRYRNETNDTCYVQLLAGEEVNLGRARKWPPKEKNRFPPNDIPLRTLKSHEEDTYISRYHGCIRRTEREIEYENRSPMGTKVDQHHLANPGDSRRLGAAGSICPGTSFARRPENSMQFHYRRTSSPHDLEQYNFLVEHDNLASPMPTESCSDVISMTRNDVGPKEQYVFMSNLALIGRSEEACGWWMNHSSINDVHGRLLWFDSSFWIQPWDRESSITIDGQSLPPCKVQRLRENARIQIGALSFLVLPDWKQHILDCPRDCCQGWGP